MTEDRKKARETLRSISKSSPIQAESDNMINLDSVKDNGWPEPLMLRELNRRTTITARRAVSTTLIFVQSRIHYYPFYCIESVIYMVC